VAVAAKVQVFAVAMALPAPDLLLTFDSMILHEETEAAPLPVAGACPDLTELKNSHSPVTELKRRRLPVASSCMQMSYLQTVTANAHEAVLFDGSVAAQTTVVVPTGRQAFGGGLHATVTEQLSEAAGRG
jgi:hypothetical protein